MPEMSEKEYRLKNDYPKTYPQDLKEKLYIIDEKKRAQMRKYYDRTSEVQNKQKIILRAKNNPEYCPQEATLSKYDWTDAEKKFLSRCAEEKKLKYAVPRPRPIRGQAITQTQTRSDASTSAQAANSTSTASTSTTTANIHDYYRPATKHKGHFI